jgi:hypothetical protein
VTPKVVFKNEKVSDISYVWCQADGDLSWQKIGANGLRQGAAKSQCKLMFTRISDKALHALFNTDQTYRELKDCNDRYQQQGAKFRD